MDDHFSNLPANEVIAFLSCSLREADKPLVDALEKHFQRLGFRCVTIGRNVAGIGGADDAIKKLMDGAHCLIGIATPRLNVSDYHHPDEPFVLSNPYLLQETAMAFQMGIPYLIFKTPEVHFPSGVLSSNLYINVQKDLSPKENPVFLQRSELVRTTLNELKQMALKRRQDIEKLDVGGLVSLASAFAAGAAVTGAVATWLFSSPEKTILPESEKEDTSSFEEQFESSYFYEEAGVSHQVDENFEMNHLLEEVLVDMESSDVSEFEENWSLEDEEEDSDW